MRESLQSRVGSRGQPLRPIKPLPINQQVMTRKDRFHQSPGFSISNDSESKRLEKEHDPIITMTNKSNRKIKNRLSKIEEQQLRNK
mmetsp:Transcript_20080/g.14802  ORF Transcript_20080/g.14802 Transcript_20080/m.14802 type:complete len:86 (+) Transcript_20080:912-1169(+)